MPLKGQDVLVCLVLSLREGEPWTYHGLADALGMSASETHAAARRAVSAGLLAPDVDRGGSLRPVRRPLLDFLAHGVRHAFFAEPGRIVRGMPTAWSAPPLDGRVLSGGEPPLVWPDAEGEVRGQAVEPLYRTAPRAARRDPRLHELLALTDAIRCGRARERKLGVEELRARLADDAT